MHSMVRRLEAVSVAFLLSAAAACNGDDSMSGGDAAPGVDGGSGDGAVDGGGPRDAAGDVAVADSAADGGAGDATVADGGDAGESDGGDAGSDAGPSGVLDLTFGGTGYVVKNALVPEADAGGNPKIDDLAFAGALDTNGNVLVGGYSHDGPAYNAAVVRFTPAGALDTTFGQAGVWSTTGSFGGNDSVFALAPGKSGGLFAAGQSNQSMSYATIWKVSAQGVLDVLFNGFGFSGRNGTAGAGASDVGNAVTTDITGSEFVVGASTVAAGTSLAVWKFTAGGLDDDTFGASNGAVTTSRVAGAPATGYFDEASSIALDAAGRLVVGGFSARAGGDFSAIVVRYTPAGVLDATFGAAGAVVLSNVGGLTAVADGGAAVQDAVDHVALDAAGDIVAAGHSYFEGVGGTERGWVVRLTPSGTLDATFGAGGSVVLGPAITAAKASSTVFGLALDSRGRVLVAGTSFTSATASSLTVWRRAPDGSADATFGNGGAFTMTGTAGGTVDAPAAIMVDGQDRPVIAGNSADAAGTNFFAAWRLTP